MPSRKLKEFLNREGIQYSSVTHSPVYTAQQEAQSSHITGKEFAKTVIVDPPAGNMFFRLRKP